MIKLIAKYTVDVDFVKCVLKTQIGYFEGISDSKPLHGENVNQTCRRRKKLSKSDAIRVYNDYKNAVI